MANIKYVPLIKERNILDDKNKKVNSYTKNFFDIYYILKYGL